MIFDVVNCSIRSLLNPELTSSWEKGLTYVAEGQITQDEYMGKIKIVVSDQQPFMIDGIIGFLGHYPDLYEVVGGYKDLKKAIAECNKSTA